MSTRSSAPGGPDDAVGRRLDPSTAEHVFRTALCFMLLLLAGLLVVGLPAGALVDGWRGVWATLLGVALALVFSGTTVVSVLRTTDATPIRMVSMVLGAWIVKMLVVFVALAVLSRFGFYNRFVLGVVLLAGVIGSALLDCRAVTSARMPYVDPPRDEGRIPEAGGPPA
jgi:hypothetical protein